MSIYTFGYQGRDPKQLYSALIGLDAVLCDIRYKPYSRQPGWNQKQLQELFKERYLWVQEFGNSTFNDGAITLHQPAIGLGIIQDLLTSSSIVLLCVCRHYESCHRRTVAEYLRSAGLASEELSIT